MDRTEKLRARTFEYNRFDADTEFYTLFYKEYEKTSDLSKEEHYAKAFYYAFTNLTPAISDGELIVGNRDISLSAEIQKEWDEKYYQITLNHRNQVFFGQDSHMAIDYPLILSKGLEGIIQEIDEHLKKLCIGKNTVL